MVRLQVMVKLLVVARLQVVVRPQVAVRLWVISSTSFNFLSEYFGLCTWMYPPGPQRSKPIVPPKLLMSPWCWVLVKHYGFYFTNPKQTTLLIESQEENEDLVPTGLCFVVVYILLAILYIISSPQHHRMQKNNADHVLKEWGTLNKLPWPIRIYQRAKGQENHVIEIWLEL